ncbi:MAG: FAD-dependent oxidoreductase [Candidatus Competibacteraceae bacterium]
MLENPYDLIIVGAGISGLSMAHYAARTGQRVLLLEQADRIGGSLHSHRPCGIDFWLELGAHSGFNSYGHLLGLLEAQGCLQQLCSRARVPFQILANGGLQSIFSRLHWPELLLSLPRLLTTRKAEKSVAEYYRTVLGHRNYTDLFGPAFNAVICQPADDFPADILFSRKPRRKDVMRSFTLPGGMQRIAILLAQRDDIEIRTGQSVQNLHYDNAVFTLTTTDGAGYRAGTVCLATPVAVATALLGETFPTLSRRLQTVATVTIESLGVVVRRQALSLPPLAGIIAKDDSFFSVVSRDTVPDPSYRGFTFHFKPGRLDQAGKLHRICEVLGIAANRLEDVAGKTNRLPALRVGHRHLIQEIDSRLAGIPLALTGNYFTGVSLEDCVMRSSKEFRRLQNKIG